jgi:hypothetical protein
MATGGGGGGGGGAIDAGHPCDAMSCSFALASGNPFSSVDHATTDVCVFDVDSDTDPDVVWVNQLGPIGSAGEPGGLDLSFNVDAGLFQTVELVRSLTDGWTFGIAGDVTGDGVPDVVTTRPARTRSELGLFRSADGGLVQDLSAFPLIPGNDAGFVFGRAALGDFDGDGDQDVYLPVAFRSDFASSMPSRLFFNDGLGHFTEVVGWLPTFDGRSGLHLLLHRRRLHRRWARGPLRGQRQHRAAAPAERRRRLPRRV